MRTAISAWSLLPLLAPLLLAACGGGTDITRTDDEVEEWVAEQKAEENDRKARRSQLPPAAAAGSQQEASPPPAPSPAAAPRPTPCSAAWYDQVEASVKITDAEGHGPDLGSAEWKSAVEHKLGVADDASFPELGTPAWCDRVDQLVLQR